MTWRKAGFSCMDSRVPLTVEVQPATTIAGRRRFRGTSSIGTVCNKPLFAVDLRRSDGASRCFGNCFDIEASGLPLCVGTANLPPLIRRGT
jgi:hypothetical protein